MRRFSGTAALSDLAKTATYTHDYAESNGFLTLLSDGERLTGAYALGPEAGEWLQQATLAIRAQVPLDVLRDTIQPFPAFTEIYVRALKALRKTITASRSRPGFSGRGRRQRQLVVGADDLEVCVDEDVVGPVDADVVDLVIAVAELDDPVDDASRVDGKRGFGGLIRGRPARHGFPTPGCNPPGSGRPSPWNPASPWRSRSSSPRETMRCC